MYTWILVCCYADAHALPGFGGGNGSTLIDNAACTGEEERLEDCTHNGIGVNDCPLDHSHDAGVFCDPSKLQCEQYE